MIKTPSIIMVVLLIATFSVSAYKFPMYLQDGRDRSVIEYELKGNVSEPKVSIYIGSCESPTLETLEKLTLDIINTTKYRPTVYITGCVFINKSLKITEAFKYYNFHISNCTFIMNYIPKVAIWNRSLTAEEVRKVYETERQP